jgi:hypothetical protein
MREVTLFFDHEGFQQEAEPLVQRVDTGDYEAVIRRARTIASRISRKKWILEGLGTSLLQLDELLPGPSLIGFSFLVLLSEFLHPNPFGYQSIGWIGTVVEHLGWSPRDVKLLKNGMATTYLLKPELVPDPLERPPNDERWHDPTYYWWWLRPANAYMTGWLTCEQITVFHRRLLEVQTDYEQVDVTSLNMPSSTIQADLLEDYQRGLKLFEAAIEAKVGLFYNLSS